MANEVVLLDCWDLWNKSPLLLKINPVDKKISVLVHKENLIYKSLVILQCIDEVYCYYSASFPLQAFFKLIAWAQRCLKREIASMSLPDSEKVYDFAIGMKQRMGI
ncbi:hypothetical protein POM88_008117 [Heracleum sosnowskyi]|uniref:Glutathione S-transferase n=1 Tax=Heracleum sosnowskyi TaxID=360622 RepID=A0AAD8N675_9APIA|nr:hypothetical protein POM88_008117 [Heracleum sosnowskyi]